MRSTVNSLAKRGWYIDLETPFKFLNKLNAEFKRENNQNVDLLMASYVEFNLDNIKKNCQRNHPDRWPVLREAFEAHDQNKFALSIPVFLAQADGICKDLLGVKFYARRKGIPATACKTADLEMDSVSDAILEPLREAGALNAYENEVDSSSNVLNRHAVLHGTSVDYATKFNGLRSISLVNYLSAAVSGVQQIKQITPEQIEAFKRETTAIVEEMLKPQKKRRLSATFMLCCDLLCDLFSKKNKRHSK